MQHLGLSLLLYLLAKSLNLSYFLIDFIFFLNQFVLMIRIHVPVGHSNKFHVQKRVFINLLEIDWKHGDFDVLFDLAHQYQALVHFTESYLSVWSFPTEGVYESGKGVIAPGQLGVDVSSEYFAFVHCLSSVQK